MQQEKTELNEELIGARIEKLWEFNDLDGNIEEHHRCFVLGGYFMAAVLAATSYYRGGFISCLDVSARCVKVPGGTHFRLEP